VTVDIVASNRPYSLAKLNYVAVVTLTMLIAGAGTAHAQSAGPAFDAAARRAVIETAAEALRSRYVFPDVGERAAMALESALAAGEYDDVADNTAFAQRLTADLQAVANDKHLRLSAFGQPFADPGAAPPPLQNEAGIVRADRLADNVGYLEIVAFPPLEAFQAPLDRAMAALRETRALIIDARRHGGGTPTSETYLASYLVEAGQRVAVNKFISRNPGTETFRTEEFWTSPTPFSYSGKPVYVLTSGRTFSGGEALAYDLRALRLARVVGETTAGGAHPGGMVPVGAGFAMFVPTGRGENPTTGSNWQNVGVVPDVAVPAADALKVALEQLGVSPQAADVDALSEARLFEPRAPQVAGGGPPAGPAPTGLVVGSGNFYSPIVADLDEAVAFYRDGLGFEVQGEPANADENAPLRAMFGLPDARLRWQIGRAAPTPGGVEIIEISRAGGQQVERQMQDPGAVMLMVVVRDIDGTLARLKQLGAPVVTSGGAPVPVGGGPQGVFAVVVKDPAGHFVQLVQPGMLPPAPAGLNANIVGVRVRHTVENLERSLALYRDALGLRGGAQVPPYFGEPTVLDLLGLPHDVQYRFTMLTVPTSGLGIELIEFKGARRPAEPADIADPGATRMQLRVADIDAAVAAITSAGGTFVSTGGEPLDLPAGNATLKVGIVRDPDDLFLVLIEAPPAPQ
jgi:catechol 2,3-dioxygenase-like lactoylglutathione lyase family enzyme